ncbi:MAG: amidohydrolase family protein, partial [Malacoplasma sp.]|nr:amidohydrolase family protein [Malacoplasma sp.]
DTHTHLLLVARNLQNLDLKNVFDFDNLKKIITKKINDENPKFIYANGFNEINFKPNKILNRLDLDLINDKIPIFIFRSDLHTVMVNTVGLKYLGLFERNVISHYGPEIILDDTTKLPTGVIKENACQEVRKKINSFFDFDSDYKNLVKVIQNLIKLGISTAVTCDIFEGEQDYIYSLYKKLLEEDKKVRIKHELVFYKKEQLNNFLNSIEKENGNDEFNKIIDIKIFNDGSLGSQTAFLQKHYCNNKNNFGILNYQKNELSDFINIAQKYKKQIAIHSIGDASSLRCISTISNLCKFNFARHKIIHFQLFDNFMINQVANNNIFLSVQPCFLESDLTLLNNYVQQPTASVSYSFNKIYEKNEKIISFSTDAPVCDLNPFNNLFYAIHGDLINKPKNKERAFEIFDAVKCYTENGAYSFFEEKKLGKISTNYLADFIVLNQDIFSLKNDKEILKTEVVEHYINGNKVY